MNDIQEIPEDCPLTFEESPDLYKVLATECDDHPIVDDSPELTKHYTANTRDVTVILPMKEHSERCPGKNWRDLGGRPLWQWIVDTVSAAPFVKRIVINTDSDYLMENVRKWQSEKSTPAPFSVFIEKRAPYLEGDHVHMDLILADIISRWESPYYLQVHATSPFIRPGSLRTGYIYLTQCIKDSVFSASLIRSRGMFDGRPINFGIMSSICTQQNEPIVIENSGFYFFTRDAFLQYGRRICGDHGRVPLRPWEAIDVDTPDDFELAQAWAYYQGIKCDETNE